MLRRSREKVKDLAKNIVSVAVSDDSRGVKILLVEDDPSIAEPLLAGLESHGYTTLHTTSGATAIESACAADVVLLDLGLPDIDGTEVCRALRARCDVPIIVVSARNEEIDRVVLLELGADDYVVKPFGLRELLARISAVTRRTYRNPGAVLPALTIGPLSIDQERHLVTLSGEVIELTPKEFDLLVTLALRPGIVVRRQELLEEVWDTNWFGSTKTLDVHVASLRKKLKNPRLIATVRGYGFCFDDEQALQHNEENGAQ